MPVQVISLSVKNTCQLNGIAAVLFHIIVCHKKNYLITLILSKSSASLPLLDVIDDVRVAAHLFQFLACCSRWFQINQISCLSCWSPCRVNSKRSELKIDTMSSSNCASINPNRNNRCFAMTIIKCRDTSCVDDSSQRSSHGRGSLKLDLNI